MLFCFGSNTTTHDEEREREIEREGDEFTMFLRGQETRQENLMRD